MTPEAEEKPRQAEGTPGGRSVACALPSWTPELTFPVVQWVWPLKETLEGQWLGRLPRRCAAPQHSLFRVWSGMQPETPHVGLFHVGTLSFLSRLLPQLSPLFFLLHVGTVSGCDSLSLPAPDSRSALKSPPTCSLP